MQGSTCIDVYPAGEGFTPKSIPHVRDLQSISAEELAVLWEKKWQTGQGLRIRFLDGEEALHRRVEDAARQWVAPEGPANLEFSFGRFPTAEIRVSFKGVGYRSYVGTDGLKEPDQAKWTMLLGGFTTHTPQDELERVVLHEFGHALGCVHEQASPAVNIPWNEQKVYEYYKRVVGWGTDMVDRNVLKRYGTDSVCFTGHDPDSIMQYPIPEELTIGNFSIGWNTSLSELDKQHISRMYPPD